MFGKGFIDFFLLRREGNFGIDIFDVLLYVMRDMTLIN